MSNLSRRKGVSGEREVAATYEKAGAIVRGLEGGGDHVVVMVCAGGRQLTISSEVKRYRERARLPEWWQQTVSDAAGMPVLHTRADHGEWMVTMRLDDFLAAVKP